MGACEIISAFNRLVGSQNFVHVLNKRTSGKSCAHVFKSTRLTIRFMFFVMSRCECEKMWKNFTCSLKWCIWLTWLCRWKVRVNGIIFPLSFLHYPSCKAFAVKKWFILLVTHHEVCSLFPWQLIGRCHSCDWYKRLE